MRFRIHSTWPSLSEEAQSYLTRNGGDVSYRRWLGLPEDEICREIKGLDAIIAGGEWYTRRVLDAADKLKIVARVGIGFDHIDLVAATERGIWVTNTPGANSPAVADLTIGVILCLLRNIHGMAQDMKLGRWQRFCGRELGKVTLGIIGAGSIGRQVIKRARGFGTRVLANDIAPDYDFAAEWQFEYVPLDELMADSDVISLHVPLDESTRGFIDARMLRLMKRTAYLINTSRAPVVDRAALLEVLQAKEIGGAALDVHDPAPCAPDDPLVALENVLATPWSAFNTEASTTRMSIAAAREVVAVLQGHPPTHPVNEVSGSGSA
jgi:phosphoglycerate dehydrogenase-like enzyme